MAELHARALFRILGAAVATTTLGGCCFGRSYGPSESSFLMPPRPGSGAATAAPTHAARPDGSFPDETCRDLCGSLVPEETLLGCWAANLEMSPREDPRWVRWEYRGAKDTEWQKNATTVQPARARELEALTTEKPPAEKAMETPGESYAWLDPAVCQGFQGRPRDVTIQRCELAVLPPPPPRGMPVVVCRKRRAGGCDMSFGSGRDTRARRSALAPRHTHDRCGAWLARAAASERTSVRAFAELASELARFGAPSALVRGARRARRDEVAHARAMTRLARARGARPPRVRFRASPPRSLEAFALENAVEGCVRELFGAAVLIHQSETASPELRPTFARIARDETRHAALSLRVFHWCASRLDAAARARVTAAMETSIASLLSGWEEPVSAPELGWPSAFTSQRLARQLHATIWRELGSIGSQQA